MIAKRIANGLRATGAAVAGLTESAAIIGGAGLIAYGARLVYEPAGFIVGGVLLIAGAILHARGA